MYDTAQARNSSILGLCRQYLHWVQRSVFEGQLSDAQFRLFTAALEQLVVGDDAVIVYEISASSFVRRTAIGAAPEPPDTIL